ncbi:MAG TPA: endonuclease III [bacterium]|jgi:endonuclease-3|nr:endonuclease III [bacterium]
MTKTKAAKIFSLLDAAYPDAHCELDHQGPFQLLAATILSAQCTDRNVNRATPALFKAWPTAEAMAKAKPSSVESRIRTLGLFRGKARNLVGMAQALVRDHHGQVPRSLEALVALPGVGRKTANVVLSNAFGLPGLAVDTHVLRVGGRLGLIATQDPVKAEARLCALLPPAEWGRASHLLIWHGRRVCAARKPRCAECPVRALCPSAEKA